MFKPKTEECKNFYLNRRTLETTLSYREAREWFNDGYPVETFVDGKRVNKWEF